jgi:hypothetical protein
MTPADPKTEGISPKAYLPFAALILAGIAYAAKPGKVRPAVEPPPEPPQLIVT